MQLDTTTFAIYLLIYPTAFLLGFLFGKLSIIKIEKQVSLNEEERHHILKDSFQKKKKDVKIDESKFVTSITSSSLENRGKSVGNNVEVDDDIGSSVSRLSQLKGLR